MRKSKLFACVAVTIFLFPLSGRTSADLICLDDDQAIAVDNAVNAGRSRADFGRASVAPSDFNARIPDGRFDTSTKNSIASIVDYSESSTNWSVDGSDFQLRSIQRPVDMTELHVVPEGDLSVRSISTRPSEFDVDAELQRAVTQAAAKKIYDSVRVKVKGVKRQKNDSASVWRYPVSPMDELFHSRVGR